MKPLTHASPEPLVSKEVALHQSQHLRAGHLHRLLSSPGILHWDIPGYKESVEGKPDGTDNPLKGPTVPAGLTLSFKYLSPTKISYVIKNNGKPDAYGIQTLAADSKSFTDVSWSPGKEGEKSTGFYARQ
jgi:hypothetical protein